MSRAKKLRLLEFLLIGVVMGVIEDLIAVVLATDSKFSWDIVWVVFLVALPFAFISEVVVDHPKFWSKIFREVETEVKKVEHEVKAEVIKAEREIKEKI